MKPTLQNLVKQLAKAGDALRFADAAEFLPLEQKSQLLGIAAATSEPRPQPAAGTQPVRKRKVALAAEAQISPGALGYALSICARLDADLEILLGRTAIDVPAIIRQAKGDTEVHYQIRQLGSNFLQEVTNYAWTTKNLLFVVTDAIEGLAERVAKHDGGRLNLPGQVPWVVVAGERVAA